MNIRRTFLQLRCGLELFHLPFFALIFDVDEGSRGPRPCHGHLQTPDARTLHHRRDRERARLDLAGRCHLLTERATCGCSHLHQDHGGRTGRCDGCERVRNSTGPHAYGIAATGGAVCPNVATGVRAKSSGLPGVRITCAAVTASALFFVLCRGRRV